MPEHMTKNVQSALARFTKAFEDDMGKGTLEVSRKIAPLDMLSTGSAALDIATGIGGYPCGKITEIYGLPDTSKSQLALLAARQAQIKWPNKFVAYIDVEKKVSRAFAAAHGIDLSQFMLYQPHTAEDTADAVRRFLDPVQSLVGLVVVDSVGAMMGRVEQEKHADEATIAVVARIVTRMIKMANTFADQSGAVVLVINQVRSSIGNYGGGMETPGGWGLKFQTSLQLQTKFTDVPPLTETINGDKIPVGREIAIQVKRNKLAPKGSVARVMIHNVDTKKHGPIGIDVVDETFKVGVKTGVISKSGSSYTLPNGMKFVGHEKAETYLVSAPAQVQKIRSMAVEKYRALLASAVVGDDDDEDAEDSEEASVASEPEVQPEPLSTPGPVSVPGRSLDEVDPHTGEILHFAKADPVTEPSPTELSATESSLLEIPSFVQEFS